jgi:transposase
LYFILGNKQTSILRQCIFKPSIFKIRPEINLSSAMLGQKVDIFIMAGKRKQLSNDIKNVIKEMRKSGHKLQEIADTLNIPRGTGSDVIVRLKCRGSVKNKPHTGRHRLLDERDTRVLARLVRSDRKTPLKDVTTRFNENKETQVSKRTVQHSLYQFKKDTTGEL